ncbi:putative zinc-binding metallopeptidase [Aquimarina hainanensis]|uniref:Zinc-binding metallopeptidase n=1 Tax=Aquimarina hainanensis TaxID=1578017 RepID=A0ABW5NET6_9FLAO
MRKSFEKLKFLSIIFLSVLILSNCNKDDDGIIVQPDEKETENHTDPDPTDEQGEGEQGDITLYRVVGKNLVKEKDYTVSGKHETFQKDTQKHMEIWSLVKKIVPPSYLKKMNEFIIYAGEANGTAGYVYETKKDLSTWRMGIAIDFAYDGGFNANGELAYTIIHEFGHILTLDNSQLDSSTSSDNCTNFFPGEGCAKNDAYINVLYNKFWKDIWNAYKDAQNDESQKQEFYNMYQDRFVTAYASTNPGEDIAEVFATFVTKDKRDSNSSIASQKINLMYEYNELIRLRDFIRKNTVSSSKSKRALPVAGQWKQASRIGKNHGQCRRKH